jgi:uncharacterized oligopeptide transporter (OPT) family protein
MRALLVGLLLSIVVAAYSAYAGLKVGGVYWPIITATLMSMGLLRLLGGRGASRQEINIAGTAASTGGLLAAGVIFTVPALWLLGLDIAVWDVVLIAMIGGLLGVLFTVPLRVEMLERLALPYPDGTATAAVINASLEDGGDEGGGKVRRILLFFGLAGLFAVVRDQLRWLPAVVNLDTLGWRGARGFSFGSSVTLVSLAGGFLIGPLFTGVWFLGAVASYLVAVPALVYGGHFATKAEAVAAVTRPFGIGVIVGASLAYFLLQGLPALWPMLRAFAGGQDGGAQDSGRRRGWIGGAGWLAGLALAAVVISLALRLPLWVTLVAIAGAFLVAYLAARIAGELNIDPMEIFAIALLLIVMLFVKLDPRAAVLLTAILCISAGMAGDFMQDLKAGALVGTPPADQLKAQLLSVVVTAGALGVILEALHRAYDIGSVELPAPQAVALAGILQAGGVTGPLAWGAVAGAALTLLSLWRGLGILPVALGIGLYAPIELSAPLFAGGLLRAWAERRGTVEPARLAAAGAIGGEGFVGVALAIVQMLRGA